MKVASIFFSGGQHGLGHHYRSLALVNELEAQDNFVWRLSNTMFSPRQKYFQIRDGVDYDLLHNLHQLKPDWVIIDYPGEPDEYYFKLCRQFDAKILLLNGKGKEYEQKADISIVQGYYPGEHKYSGSDWIILRKDVLDKWTDNKRTNDWFVFGGSSDQMGLLNAFHIAMPNSSAFLVGAKGHVPQGQMPSMNDNHMPCLVDDGAIHPFMGMSKNACVAFGMTAWECAYLDMPVYAFSLSDEHLLWAKGAEDAGLIKVWPEKGLPKIEKISSFLNEKFEITGKKPDGMATKRIIELMEKEL